MPDETFDLEAVRARQARAREAAAIVDLDTEPPAPDPTPTERATAIANCDRCDAHGYTPARVVCDHREHSTPERRAAAMAEIRAAINNGHKR